MSRPIVPPRGVWVPSQIIFDFELAPTVRDTAIQLLALAWGKAESPEFSLAQLSDLTGKSVSSLYEHLRLLKARGVLRWRPVGSAAIRYSFEGEHVPNEGASQDSRKSELPDLYTKSQLPVAQKKTCNSEILENRKAPPTAQASKTNDIKAEYVRLLGGEPDSWGAGESAAAKAIAERYTVSQFATVYNHIKAQAFWKDKALNLRHVRNQMQGVLSYLEGKHAIVSAGNTADDETAEAINAGRANRAVRSG